MLDLTKGYYVSGMEHVKSVINSWASYHAMKVGNKAVCLPECLEAYELDVQYNDDLQLRMKKERGTRGGTGLYDGQKKIGNVVYCSGDNPYIIIFPVIEDR